MKEKISCKDALKEDARKWEDDLGFTDYLIDVCPERLKNK